MLHSLHLGLKQNFLWLRVCRVKIPHDMGSKSPAWMCQVDRDPHSWHFLCHKEWGLLPYPSLNSSLTPWPHDPKHLRPDIPALINTHQLGEQSCLWTSRAWYQPYIQYLCMPCVWWDKIIVMYLKSVAHLVSYWHQWSQMTARYILKRPKKMRGGKEEDVGLCGLLNVAYINALWRIQPNHLTEQEEEMEQRNTEEATVGTKVVQQSARCIALHVWATPISG